MIIKCPKCKTRFEIKQNDFSNSEIKFQCAECAYVWVEKIAEETVDYKLSRDAKVAISEKLPSMFVQNKKEVEKVNNQDKLFSLRNLVVFLLTIFFFFVIFFVFQMVVINDTSDNLKGMLDIVSTKKEKENKLYIELAKPLTMVKEGSNEYIIIRGFIYNQSENVADIPKLVIRLENREERVLQEQEREVEVKKLNPGQKTDFMFKVFKFSSQVARVKVEFAPKNKI